MSNAENTKVTFGKGEEICSCCGAHIRNIVWVNEVPYGTTCVEGVLPRNEVKKIKTTKFNQLIEAQRIAKVQAERQALATYFTAILPKSLINRTDKEYNDYLINRPCSQYWLAIKAVIEYRKLA